MDSILPFCTLMTCLLSFSLPRFLWLKLHWWSSGSRWELQKKSPQRHSTPSSLSLRLQVEQRSLLAFSTTASSTTASSFFFSSSSLLSLFALTGATGAVSSFFGSDAPSLSKGASYFLKHCEHILAVASLPKKDLQLMHMGAEDCWFSLMFIALSIITFKCSSSGAVRGVEVIKMQNGPEQQGSPSSSLPLPLPSPPAGERQQQKRQQQDLNLCGLPQQISSLPPQPLGHTDQSVLFQASGFIQKREGGGRGGRADLVQIEIVSAAGSGAGITGGYRSCIIPDNTIRTMSAKQGKEAAAPAAPASPSPARTLPFQILRNHRQPPADLAPPQERIFASESFRETMCTLIGSPAPSVRKIKKERRGKKYSTASQQKRQIASRFVGLAEDSEERDGESASLWRWLWEPELESFRREGELELLAIFGRPLSPAQQEEEEAFRKQEEREMMPPAASFLPPAEAPHEVLPVISSGPEKNEVEEEHELFFYSALGYHQIESYNPRNQQSEDQFFNHAAGNHDFN